MQTIKAAIIDMLL